MINFTSYSTPVMFGEGLQVQIHDLNECVFC